MNLVEPEAIAKAVAPLLSAFEERLTILTNGIAVSVNDAVHGGIDRLNGATITVTITLPPRQIPVE